MRIREKGGNLLQRVNVNFLETETCSISWSPWSLYNCVHVKSHWNDTSIISFQRNWGTEQMSTTAFHICLTELKIQLPWEHNLFFSFFLQETSSYFCPGGSISIPQSIWKINFFQRVIIKASPTSFLVVPFIVWARSGDALSALCIQWRGASAFTWRSGGVKNLIHQGLQALPATFSSLESFLLTMQYVSQVTTW